MRRAISVTEPPENRTFRIIPNVSATTTNDIVLYSVTLMSGICMRGKTGEVIVFIITAIYLSESREIMKNGYIMM